MRFALTDEQIEFSEAVRALLENVCTPDDVRSTWPDAVLAGGGSGLGSGRVPAAWKALAEMGVLGLTVPEAFGGLGMTDEDLSPLIIEAGRVALPDPLVATAGVAPRVLARCAADPGADASKELLARIATGEASIGLLFGPGDEDIAPSDLLASATSLDFVISFTGESVALVGSDDLELTKVASVDGARDLARASFTGHTVLVDSVLADSVLADSALADGASPRSIAVDAFDSAALHTSAELLGLSERMLELAVSYATERTQFGVPIGSFQAIKHHLAGATMAVEFARPLIMRAAYSMTNGDVRASQHVSMAKARASEAADLAARASLQVHGAIGYTVEYDLHLYMKRAWALERQYGDARFHKLRIRRSLSVG